MPARAALAAAAAARPAATLFALVVDGYDPRYTAGAAGAALAPTLRGLRSQFVARAAMPTFTNVNNVSLLTATPPAAHGVAGNFLYDETTRTNVPMTDASAIRADSLLAEAHAAGFDVVICTAKDKLVRLLRHQLPADAPSAVSTATTTAAATVTVVSIESAAAAQAEGGDTGNGGYGSGSGGSDGEAVAALVRALLRGGAATAPHGGRLPTIYEPYCSVAAVEAGGALVRHLRDKRRAAGLAQRPAIAFVSTTDFVQHKHAPHSPGANEFFRALDAAVAALLREHPDCVLGVTADHGMSEKHDAASGSPRIVFLEQLLRDARIPARVVLPITDAHVVHHAALGGYANVHVGEEHLEGLARPPPFGDGWRRVAPGEVLPPGLEIRLDLQSAGAATLARRAGGGARRAAMVGEAAALLRAQPGVLRVLARAEAAALYALPPEGVGDLVVVADEGHVLGKSAGAHDLSMVARLRSHGGEHERAVPLLLNWQVAAPKDAARLASGEAASFELLPLLFEAAAAAAAAAEEPSSEN